MKERDLNLLLSKIGSELIALRKLKGYTSHETFSYDYDLPRIHYWRMEKGKTNLTMGSLSRVLAIHGLTIEEFFWQIHQKKTVRLKK